MKREVFKKTRLYVDDSGAVCIKRGKTLIKSSEKQMKMITVLNKNHEFKIIKKFNIIPKFNDDVYFNNPIMYSEGINQPELVKKLQKNLPM